MKSLSTAMAMVATVSFCVACNSNSNSSDDSAASSGCASVRYSIAPLIGCPESSSRATLPSLNGSWLGVTANGSVYVRDSGGGGLDHLYRYDSSSAMTNVSSLLDGDQYGGDLAVIGNKIYAIGAYVSASTPYTNILEFNDGDNASSLAFNWQNNWYSSALGVVNSGAFYFGSNVSGEPLFSANLSSQTGSPYLTNTPVSKIHMDSVNQRLYFVEGSTISYAVEGLGGTTVSVLATITDPNASPGRVEVGDLTTDEYGFIYATCRVNNAFIFSSCSQGSVLMIAPDDSQVIPLVSSSNYVASLSYLGSSDQLYMLMSQTSGPGQYSLEVMNITP